MQPIWTKKHITVNEVQLKSMHESETIQDIFINTCTLSLFRWKNSREQ